MYFKSSVRQAPKFAKPGFPGKRMDIRLELKLMADVGLLGFPNAGKSTLISVCSAASPKIANYPFTTLAPQLGVVSVGDDSFVMADIPGIIEGASEGKGLGLRFLKHLERTNILLHLVDISMCPTTFDSFERYIILRQELEKYDPHLFQKKEMIVFTKIDALSEEKIQEHVQFFENQLGKKILPISSVSGKNLNQLKNILWKTIQKERG
jgi:GTP-binding protein